MGVFIACEKYVLVSENNKNSVEVTCWKWNICLFVTVTCLCPGRVPYWIWSWSFQKIVTRSPETHTRKISTDELQVSTTELGRGKFDMMNSLCTAFQNYMKIKYNFFITIQANSLENQWNLVWHMLIPMHVPL